MARKSSGSKAPNQPGAVRRSATGNQERFSQISRASSQIVRDAAALLDEEMAAGIVAARNVQQRFERERRIESADFAEALQRFQGDAHEVVNLLHAQFAELRSEENAELITRFVDNAHNLLDVVIGLVNTGADIANQLAAENLPKRNAKPNGRRR
jgi:hypothetical protein